MGGLTPTTPSPRVPTIAPCPTRCRRPCRRAGSPRSPTAPWPTASPTSTGCRSHLHRTRSRARSCTPPSSASSPCEAPERTPEAGAVCLAAAAAALRGDEEFVTLGLDDDGTAAFVADAERLLGKYFAMEDPTQVHAIGIELRLEAEVGGVSLRGIIDRLDLLPDGSLRVVDYKSGRSPGRSTRRRSCSGSTPTRC